MKSLKILFAVHDWGLGHATRDLVLLRALIAAGHRVTVLSTGRAMRLLQDELGGGAAFIQLDDIPKPLSRRAFVFIARMTLALPRVFATFRREGEVVRALHRWMGFDRIVSDTRYGVHLPDVPSYLIVHSLRHIVPGRPGWIEKMVEEKQREMFSGFTKVLVPDEPDHGLAGDLCHRLACSWDGRAEYIGILSSVRRRPARADVDTFISVSGAEPQRGFFEEIVLAGARHLRGRTVIALGRPDLPRQVRRDGPVTIHTYMGRSEQEEMMNRARLVVTRSGYTTLMELAELGKAALVVPTVGQTEQEYLGAYHEGLGHVHCVKQASFSLPRDAEAARRYRGLPRVPPTERSVERFLRAIAA